MTQRPFPCAFMMAVAIILLLLCYSARAEIPTEHPCPINEEFSPTGGPLCEGCGPRCQAVSSEPKCYCKPKYSRFLGICILDELCPPNEPGIPEQHSCSINEEFRQDGGPACENCGVKCTLMLTEAKCYCKKDFSRLNGVCIPDFACPRLLPETPEQPSCPKNEEFRSEGPLLECENCGIRCAVLSLVPKCYCKARYWRLNGDCVPESDCPKEIPETPKQPPCPKNEEFRSEGPLLKCENCGIRCAVLSLEPKCYCKRGYWRLNGDCIPESECPKEIPVPDQHPCPVNEEFRSGGGPACESCGSRSLGLSSEAKCYCKSGYSRVRGTCIPDAACPTKKPTCPVNEEYSSLGGPKCENCGPRCLALSYEAKCYCKSGFSRRNGICIRNSLCPNSRKAHKWNYARS